LKENRQRQETKKEKIDGFTVCWPAFLRMFSMAHSFFYRQDGFELSLNLNAKIRNNGKGSLWFHTKCAFLHLIFIRKAI